MADYNPKARRARPEPSPDEPAPVDALLDAVEHSADAAPANKPPKAESTTNGSSVNGTTPSPAADPVASVAPGTTADPVAAADPVAGAAPIPPANPWVSSVPESAGSKARVVVAALAVVAAIVVVLAVVRRRRS